MENEQPLNSTVTSRSIKWNEETWYSKLFSAIFIFGALPAVAFYVGVEYQRTEQEIHSGPIQVCVSPKEIAPFVEKEISPMDEYYSKDENHVYYFKVENDKTILKDADPPTFVEVGGRYGKDKRYVYYATAFGGVLIVDADLATFTYVGEMRESHAQVNPSYARDKSRVYRDEEVILGADPDTFQLLTYDYSRDSQSVFWFIEKISEADPETFEIMNNQYAKDKNSVYREGTAVHGLDPKTFDGTDRG